MSKEAAKFKEWRNDWNVFVKEVLKARLDKEQQAIITSVQHNPMTAVASGTARGKDFVAACCALCFLYLTPKFDKKGALVENTKIAMTAPTGRQVSNIMTPEVRKLWRKAGVLPGRAVSDDIRTNYEEWFLTGFKAGDDATEAWSGFHAANTMFIVTEASGISEATFNAIEGNLQGNSRLLIVFNPNVTTGYAAKAMKSDRFHKFRLNSLNAENVTAKKQVISGQVDYEWVKDKVENWCTPIQKDSFDEGEGDFEFEGSYYRPDDLFRVKVLGMFPKVSSDSLIPYEWIELANKRWLKLQEENFKPHGKSYLGADVAGMGRDESVLCKRWDNYISGFERHQSAGKADHMHVAGMIVQHTRDSNCTAYIDTIGEGAGVFSRLNELGYKNIVSCKASHGSKGLTDITGQYTFSNAKAFMYWSVRDWLDPKNKKNAAIPPNDKFMQEATEIKWEFGSNGAIQMESKDKLKARLGRSPDDFDVVAYTFCAQTPRNLGVNYEDISTDFS